MRKIKTEQATVKTVLINYFDVWGNSKEGYEVNNLCNEGILILSEDNDNAEILRALKNAGMLKKHVRLNMLDIENYGDRVEINRKRDYKPMFALDFYGADEENIKFYGWKTLNE